MVAHLLAFAVPLVVVVIAILNFSFFAWHPICMIIGVILLMNEAIQLFSPSSSLLPSASRVSKATYHGYLMFGALVAILAGFVQVYIYKNLENKEHFTSWHGLLGLVFVIYATTQLFAGILLKYQAIKFLSVAEQKFYHGMSGCVVFLIGCVDILLGMYSNWFVRNAHEYVRGACLVSVALLGMMGLNHLLHVLQSKIKTKVK